MMVTPRYAEVRVRLSGTDGNAFAVLGRVAAALRAARVPRSEVEALWAEGTSGDYGHLLATVGRWVTVTVGDEEEELHEIKPGEEWATDGEDD
jgi:hypothetical protein